MMSEAEGVRKKRKCLTAACERCRQKKIGCDVQYPCGHCVAASADCVFGQQRKRGRQRAVDVASASTTTVQRVVAVRQPETVNHRESGLVGEYLHDYYVQAFMDFVEPLEPLWERDKAMHGAMRLSWLRRDEPQLTETQRFQKAAALAFVARSCLHNAVADQFLAEARTDLGQAIDDFSTCTATGLCFLATTHWGTDWVRFYHYLRVARSVLSGLPRTQRAAIGQFTSYGLRDYTAGIRKLSNIFHKLAVPMDGGLDALVTRRDHLRTLFLSRQLVHAPVVVKVVVQFCENSTLMDLLANRVYCLARYPNLVELNPTDRPFLDDGGAVALLKGAEQLEALVTQDNRLAFGHASDTVLLNVVMLRIICYWPRRMFVEADAAAWNLVEILGRITTRTFYMPFMVIPATAWLGAYAVDQRRVELAQALVRFLEPLRSGVPIAQDIVTILNGELLQAGSDGSLSPGSTRGLASGPPLVASPLGLDFGGGAAAMIAAAAGSTTTAASVAAALAIQQQAGVFPVPPWGIDPSARLASANRQCIVAHGTPPTKSEEHARDTCEEMDMETTPAAGSTLLQSVPIAAPDVIASEKTSELARHYVEAALANTRAVNLVVKVLEADSPLIHGRIRPHGARSDAGTESTALQSPACSSPPCPVAAPSTPPRQPATVFAGCEYEPWLPEVTSFLSPVTGEFDTDLFNLTDVGCR